MFAADTAGQAGACATSTFDGHTDELAHTFLVELIRMAVERGRSTRPDLPCGICGEHGGDPHSVKFCHHIGLNYVSCSPFRVPIARLSAAQAAIE